MAKKKHFDDFRIVRRGGEIFIGVRSSPEDFDEYPLKKGLNKISTKLDQWDDTANNIREGIHEAQEKVGNLEKRGAEAIELIHELLKAGEVDEDELEDLGFPWEMWRD